MKRVGGRQVWSLADVTGAVSRRFDDIPSVWLEAEVHDLRRRGSQVYFTLRDGHTLSASMNASVFERLAAPPGDGGLVHAYGRIEFWAERSQVSMRVDRLELAGAGLLLAEIERLRELLAAEGLLADARKTALPLLPRRIGLVTSARGAARADVLENLWSRFPIADVLLVDVPVQGDPAPDAIARALHLLDARTDIDVIIVARGGGSLEDLMAFNSERVCRAVATCATPVVSAVGHEKDVTLCDLVADRRVSTPTGAAEVVVPDLRALTDRLGAQGRALGGSLTTRHRTGVQRLDVLASGLTSGLRRRASRAAERVDVTAARLAPSVRHRVEAGRSDAEGLAARAERALCVCRDRAQGRLAHSGALLETLSPARTVARGYAIVRDGASGAVVETAAQMRAAGNVRLSTRDGVASADIRDEAAT